MGLRKGCQSLWRSGSVSRSESDFRCSMAKVSSHGQAGDSVFVLEDFPSSNLKVIEGFRGPIEKGLVRPTGVWKGPASGQKTGTGHV